MSEIFVFIFFVGTTVKNCALLSLQMVSIFHQINIRVEVHRLLGCNLAATLAANLTAKRRG
jgi:hypothetical protein